MLKHRIDYPVPTEAFDAQGFPLHLWAPTPLVETVERSLPRGSRVIDIGSGRGANGMYLAMQGHEVYSIESSAQTVREGQQIGRSLGEAVMSHLFVRADMRELDLEAEFGPVDAVLAIRSLQQVPMLQAQEVVAGMQAVTKPGGLNAMVAYIARPDQQQTLSHLALFEPGQLEAVYEDAGWGVALSQAQLHELDYAMGSAHCQSTVDLIAAKPTGL